MAHENDPRESQGSADPQLPTVEQLREDVENLWVRYFLFANQYPNLLMTTVEGNEEAQAWAREYLDRLDQITGEIYPGHQLQRPTEHAEAKRIFDICVQENELMDRETASLLFFSELEMFASQRLQFMRDNYGIPTRIE